MKEVYEKGYKGKKIAKDGYPFPFPNGGKLCFELASRGWIDEDILEIREILVKEIKRQNEEELKGGVKHD